MTAPVTLRRLMSGDYQVQRGEQRWTPPVLVRRSSIGWSVTHRGAVESVFRTQRDVRAWLNGPDGARWLDSLDGAL